MNTSCEKCAFAIYEDNIQSGCKAGRLTKFQDTGSEVEHKDNYFIIKDRICMMCCPEETIVKLGFKNPLQDMRKAIELKCAIYIIATDNSTLEDIKLTIDSLNKQTLRPRCINVIVNTDNISKPRLIKHLNDTQSKFENDNLEFIWNITYIQEKDKDGERPSIEWALDHAIFKCEMPFYAVFMAGYMVCPDYLSNIDKALNDELQRFCVLLPFDEWNGAFVQTLLHKKLGGNAPQTLEEYEDGALIATTIMDKIEWMAKENNQHMVKKAEEICPLKLVW